MTCIELLDHLKKLADPQIASRFVQTDGSILTCDHIKAGDPNREVKKIAVAMFPTPEVIKNATEYGADLLIVHEPTYYNHWDNELPNLAAELKQQLIEQSGLTIFRLHDYAHARANDLIYEGEMKLLDLKGHKDGGNYAHNTFVLDEPMTARELAKRCVEKLGAEHVRIAGCTDKPGKKIRCSFGAAGCVWDEIGDCDFYLTGEISEWADAEYARDMAQFGYNKAIIVLTHEVSERAGMMLLAEQLRAMYPDIEAQYFESGAVYSYVN